MAATATRAAAAARPTRTNESELQGERNGTENPSGPRGLQEASLLPRRRRRRAFAARRPLHRDSSARGTRCCPRTASASSSTPTASSIGSATARCRPTACSLPRRGRHRQARGPLQPEQGPARQEGAGARRTSKKAQDDAAAAIAAATAAPAEAKPRPPNNPLFIAYGTAGALPAVLFRRSYDAARSIACRAAGDVDASIAIAIAALAPFGGAADQRAGDGADSTTNNSSLHRVICNGSADSSATQATDRGALFCPGTGCERGCQYHQDHQFLHRRSSQMGFSVLAPHRLTRNPAI